MSGDDLTIVLFLAGLSATLACTGLGISNSTHRRVLFVFAAIGVILAIIWPILKAFWIPFQAYISPIQSIIADTAKSPIAWFAIIVLFLSTYLTTSRSKQSQGPSLPVASEAQRQRLTAGDFVRRENAARLVLGGLTDNARILRFVYSSTRVDGFVDQTRQPITNFPFLDEELQVTAIPDAHGVGYLHSLLALSGKRQSINVLTSRYFRPEHWNDDLILVGSPNANAQTGPAINRFGCPYSFSADVSCIEERTPQGVLLWPKSKDEFKDHDYAILAKITRLSAGVHHTCVIVAGIGALGTLGACYFLNEKLIEIADRFGANSFAAVLHIDRGIGYVSVSEVHSRLLVAPS